MADPAAAAGEAGGIFAGAVALLYAIGKGGAWLLNWKDARAQSRAAKLQAWHDELEKRETEQDERDRRYQQHIETQLRRLTAENRVLRRAFELVAEPLRRIEPTNPALAQAQQMLDRAFPIAPGAPEDMAVLLSMLDHPGPAAELIS
ncbi:hypothetical protein [Sphingobium yanoikuyae]|uniref:hypothetical protein n=1 Tax=Sphingobium yanoikuyae TaxID=13690 RepID=UPI00242EE52B|nr:hypothetical protein [Sphingobium yanoikuyae]